MTDELEPFSQWPNPEEWELEAIELEINDLSAVIREQYDGHPAGLENYSLRATHLA